MAVHDAGAGKRNQSDLFFFTRLESRGRAGGDIQAHAVGGAAIEMQGAVDFIEMIMAADLNGAIAGIFHQ